MIDAPVLTCARGTEEALVAELEGHGLKAEVSAGVVRLQGGLDEAYDAALWSRIAGRVLLPLARFEVRDVDGLYDALRTIRWQDHLGSEDTLAIDAAVGGGRRDHTRFLSQRVKDAIVDHFRDLEGQRPSVDTRFPDVRFHLHWSQEATLSVDLAGPLHRRGYRPKGAPAPLRETLAAALLQMSGWTPQAPLLDAMCGSGTFLVEAACMARRVAPGRNIQLGRWRGHEPSKFATKVAAAKASETHGTPLAIAGQDRDPDAVRLCKESLKLAGVAGVRVRVGEFRDVAPPFDGATNVSGHMILNPPYGERLGERGELLRLYPMIGDVLKERFGGWQAHVLTSDKHLAGRVGLRPDRKWRVFNGALECQFASYSVRAKETAPSTHTPTNDTQPSAIAKSKGPGWRKVSAEAAMFENRLRKNKKRLAGWAKGAGLEAFRLYDTDIPEYNVSVDRYGDYALVQEHRPRNVDPAQADRRLHDVMVVVAQMLDLPDEKVAVRVRHRHSDSQYEKRGSTGERFVVMESGHRFEVNLQDYLDTGLFLDHRRLRKLCAKTLKGREQGQFLNLFSYTCSASVYAAKAGARTTSVDLSGTYLDWGQANFEANDIDPARHRFVRADVVRWLARHDSRYDCILLAPPSYSRSKGMDRPMDLRTDHRHLIADAYGCLKPGGTLFFSTHARAFELDDDLFSRFGGEDITQQTVPRDFPRKPHRSWRFVRK